LVKQLAKRRASQSKDAKLGKDLLLSHAKTKRIASQVWLRLRIRRLFDNKFRSLRVKRYDSDHSSSFAGEGVAAQWPISALMEAEFHTYGMCLVL
jgi:hypothetical protein